MTRCLLCDCKASQDLKINECNLLYQQVKEENTQDQIN